MNRWSASLALAGLAVLLSGCVYYPNGPYGPGYGPYHPGYDQPPPGPGPGDGPPPPQTSYPPPEQQQGDASGGPSDAKTAKQMAKMNDPTWCNQHPKKCAKLQNRYGQPQQGPGDQGPPQQGPDDQGPPPPQQ